MKVTIYADGGSRGNPGVAGSGTVLYDEHSNTLAEIVYVVGQKASNNVAEYHGLLRGLEAARDLGATEVDVFMDSKLVVEQMSGRWKIKHPDMQKLALEAKKIARGFTSVSYTWVPRAKNKKADELSNLAMDAAARGDAPGIVGGEVAAPAPAEAGAPQPAEASAEPNHEVATHAHWHGIEEAPTRFVLLRHGQTEHSANKCYSGSSNPVLTEIGLDQARRAAEWLKHTEQVDVVVASPLTRAQQTATIVADAFGKQVHTMDDLREMDFGLFEGKTRDQVVAEFPEELRAWESSISVAPPKGESVAAMHRRITRARLKLQEKYAGKTVLVVTHVTPIKSFVRQGLGSNGDTFARLFLDLASVSAVEFYPETAVVRKVNDTAHLVE